MEVIQEREAYCKLQDVWKNLACIQPNLLGKTCKKMSSPVKKVKGVNNHTSSNEVQNCRTCSQCGQQGHNRRICHCYQVPVNEPEKIISVALETESEDDEVNDSDTSDTSDIVFF